MKTKTYEKPEINIIDFTHEDIITTSVGDELPPDVYNHGNI